MKRMFTLLITLFIIYFGIQFAYNYFSKGHDITYEVNAGNESILVHEKLVLNKSEDNHYFIEVNYNNEIIPFKIFNTYSRQERIVRYITILQADKYTCALLNFENDEIPNDIKCLKDGIAYYYSSIRGDSKFLDELISQTNYEISDFDNNENNVIQETDNIKIYPNNFPNKQSILFEGYKGIYVLGNKIKNKVQYHELFSSDIYNKPIQGQVGKYYILPNYNIPHYFDELIVINMASANREIMKINYQISYNSFVQGTVDGKIYVIDKDNKKQFVINPKNKTIEVYNNIINVYVNGLWQEMNISEVISENITFNNYITTYNGEQYDRVILRGDENNGTYYLFKKNKNSYDVYSVYTNSLVKNYLFTTTSLDRIQFVKDYVYYVNEDSIMMFSPEIGTRKILSSNELKYNSNIKFYVY